MVDSSIALQNVTCRHMKYHAEVDDDAIVSPHLRSHQILENSTKEEKRRRPRLQTGTAHGVSNR
jgi:hypothetical protein